MSFTEHIKNHKAIPHIATDIVNTPAGNIVATNVQTAINELDTEKIPYIGGTGNVDIGDFELRAQTLESDVATGTAPLTIASTTVNTNLNADLLDNLHGTGYTKTTSGQTINVSTAAELTAALSALSAAPSLLDDVIIQLAAGTYADAVMIPSLIGNGFSLILSGNKSTTETNTLTSGTSGTQTVQATVTRALAGWTINEHRGKLFYFTSGTFSGKYKVINSNTATVISFAGASITANPTTETYEIKINTANITGKITMPPNNCDVVFRDLDITFDNVMIYRAKVSFLRCKLNVINYTNVFDSSTILISFCYGVYQNAFCCIQEYLSYVNCWQDYFYGGGVASSSFAFMAKGGYYRVQKGSVFENFGTYGSIWCNLMGSVEMLASDVNETGDIDTNVFVKNNGLGLKADAGGHITLNGHITYSGNTTDATADAASYSWIG